MGKPRLIILIRHGQSEGNRNKEIHQMIPDHRVKLTEDGQAQARDAGRRLRDMLNPDDTIQFFTSPYRRTRETTEGILETLTSDEEGPSPYRRANIKVYEEPRLREQDFGNFQPCSAEMERMWQERADYGHFFYRIPNGESAADAYDRVSGFNESLWRQFSDDDFPSVCVLVTHGLMSRVFLMKWYHFTVEYFEDLRNVNHCEFLIMRKNPENQKYVLENKLRTWSALRRERAALRAKEEKETDVKKPQRQNSLPVTRKWGGCPEGCNHNHFKIRRDLQELRQHDEYHAKHGHSNGHAHAHAHAHANGNGLIRRNMSKRLGPNNSDDDSDDPRGHIAPQTDATRPREDAVPSADTKSSTTAAEHRSHEPHRTPLKPHFLHVGRDFGGTFSGHASEEDFSEEISEEDARKRLADKAERVRRAERGSSTAQNSKDHEHRLSVRATYVNKLGDSPDTEDPGSDECGDEAEDLDKAEEKDRSILGSVY